MYNGIGLATPRGSGTNGYVQRNLAFINSVKEKIPYKTDDEVKRADAMQFKEPNKEILEHERKRKIEVKCVEMEELMEEQGYTQKEINLKVSAYRLQQLEQMKLEDAVKKRQGKTEAVNTEQNEHGRLVPKGTHETAAVNILKNTVFKDALGIGPDFEEGNSMEQANARRKDELETKRLLEAQKEMVTIDSSDEADNGSDTGEVVVKHKKDRKRNKRKRHHHEEKSKSKKRKHEHPSTPSDSDSSDSTSASESHEEHEKRRRRSHKKSRSESHKRHSRRSEKRRHRH